MAQNGISLSAAAALATPTLMFAGFELGNKVILPVFLTNNVGMDVAIAGLWLLAMRLLHILTDWAGAAISDAPLGKRWGRRRLWMVLGMAPALAGTAGIFFATPGVSVAQITIGLLLMTAGWSLINSAHGAWALEAGSSVDDRSLIFGLRTAAGVAGYLGFSALAAWAGSDARQQLWVLMLGLFLGVPLSTCLACWKVPERPPSLHERFTLRSLGAALGLVASAPARARLAALFAVVGAHHAVVAGSLIYTVRDGLALPDIAGPALVAQAAAMCVGLPLGMAATRYLGAERTLLGVFVIELIAAALLLVLPAGRPLLAMAWLVFRSLASGVDFMILRALAGQQLDADVQGRSQARAGAYYAAFHLPFNIAAALATGGLFWLYDAVGFDPQASWRGARVLLQIPGGAGAALALAAIALLHLRVGGGAPPMAQSSNKRN